MIVLPGEPVAKPRQSQSDRWKKRPCVVRYREWADRLRLAAAGQGVNNDTYTLRFFFEIPASWSRFKREQAVGRPHGQKPDIDNLQKAVLDALLPDGDQKVWRVRAEKRWDDGGGPRVEILPGGQA